jgi:predicted DNA-binding transcriptional regulator YafY
MRQAARPALRRIVAIDRAIRSGVHPNAVSIAEQLEVAPRTVQRDIEFMRDSLGAPLTFSRRHNGYEYSDSSFQLPYFKLTEGELVALFVAEQALRQYRGTPYEADLARAFKKLAASLPDEITIDLSAVGQTHSFRTSATTLHDLETFRRLAAATVGREQLRLTYWTASRDAVTRRVVDPYHLANVDGDWYLIAYCHLREDVRMFSPARIRKLELTGETFTPPAEFSIARYLDGAFRVIRDSGASGFEVRLRFTPGAAKYIREKVWHPTQTLIERPDAKSASSTSWATCSLRRRRCRRSADRKCPSPTSLRARGSTARPTALD